MFGTGKWSLGGMLVAFAVPATAQTSAEPVWADEFDGPGISAANWTLETGTGAQYGLVGWGNNELQYYTTSSNNAYVSDGRLHIVARQQSVGGMAYTSARLMSRGKVFGMHGRIEARIRIPSGQGLWPAFWMLRENGVWPGEIDIMEVIGSAPHRLHATCHQGALPNLYSLGDHLDAPTGVNWAEDFHVFGVEWWPGQVIWTVDGEPYYAVNKADVLPNHAWLFEEDMYLLLNLAVGGNWPGPPGASTAFPAHMEVDWVRWYDLPTAAQPVTFRVDASSLNLAPGAIVHINGSFNGWCGSCAPMVNNGTGHWSKVVWLSPGLHEYKFSVNGWSGAADTFVPGDVCTIATYGSGITYVNRFVAVRDAPVSLPEPCFSSCFTCSGGVPVQPEPVVFRMHHADVVGGEAVVVVEGVGEVAMTAGYAGSYRAQALALPGAAYSYRMNGLDEVLGTGCGPRHLPDFGDFQPFADCFGTCVPCGVCGVAGSMNYNPFAHFSGGCAGEVWMPGCTYPSAENFNPDASLEDGSCTWGKGPMCPGDEDESGTVGVTDLLILLGNFGDICY